MPVRAIDPKSALLIIDFQEGTRRYTGYAGPAAYAAAARLAAAFRRCARPVFLVRMKRGHSGRTDVAPYGLDYSFPPEAMEFVPELGRQPADIVITKSAWGAFFQTDLDEYLEGLEVTHVVICGTAATVGVESTARQAHERGFNITIALDAVTDLSAEALKYASERSFRVLAETGMSTDVIAALEASVGIVSGAD